MFTLHHMSHAMYQVQYCWQSKLVYSYQLYCKPFIYEARESRLQQAFICLCIPRWLDLLLYCSRAGWQQQCQPAALLLAEQTFQYSQEFRNTSREAASLQDFASRYRKVTSSPGAALSSKVLHHCT